MKVLIAICCLVVAVVAQRSTDYYDNLFSSAYNQDSSSFNDNQNANSHLGRFNFEADESANSQSNYPNYPQESQESGLDDRYGSQESEGGLGSDRFNSQAHESGLGADRFSSQAHEGALGAGRFSSQAHEGGLDAGRFNSQAHDGGLDISRFTSQAHEGGLDGRYRGQIQYAADEDNRNSRYVQQQPQRFEQPQLEQLNNRFRELRFINL